MKEEAKQKERTQKHVRNRTIRTDSLLRETSSSYIKQIGDADRKARILLVVTSVMITIGVTVLTKNVIVIPLGWISAAVLVITNVITLIFVILSIRPMLNTDAAGQSENNILHYKTCTQFSLRQYTTTLVETLDDDQKKRDAIIKELYYHGNLLNEKYKYIQRAYKSFLWSIVLALASYLVIYLFYKF